MISPPYFIIRKREGKIKLDAKIFELGRYFSFLQIDSRTGASISCKKATEKELQREKVCHYIARPAHENKVVGCGICQGFMICVGHGATINAL